MKRVVLLILVLVVFVDLAEDGYLGNVKHGPLQTAASVAGSIFPHHPSKQVDPPRSLPSPAWQDIFGLRRSQPVIQEGQRAPKMITFCNIGCSGGIPL
jgi:hypothetical protein